MNMGEGMRAKGDRSDISSDNPDEVATAATGDLETGGG